MNHFFKTNSFDCLVEKSCVYVVYVDNQIGLDDLPKRSEMQVSPAAKLPTVAATVLRPTTGP